MHRASDQRNNDSEADFSFQQAPDMDDRLIAEAQTLTLSCGDILGQSNDVTSADLDLWWVVHPQRSLKEPFEPVIVLGELLQRSNRFGDSRFVQPIQDQKCGPQD